MRPLALTRSHAQDSTRRTPDHAARNRPHTRRAARGSQGTSAALVAHSATSSTTSTGGWRSGRCKQTERSPAQQQSAHQFELVRSGTGRTGPIAGGAIYCAE